MSTTTARPDQPPAALGNCHWSVSRVSANRENLLRGKLFWPFLLDSSWLLTTDRGTGRDVSNRLAARSAQYRNHCSSASTLSAVYGGKRCSIATSGGDTSIDFAWDSISNPY